MKLENYHTFFLLLSSGFTHASMLIIASLMSFRLCSLRHHSIFSGAGRCESTRFSSGGGIESTFSVISTKALKIAGASPAECSYVNPHSPSYVVRIHMRILREEAFFVYIVSVYSKYTFDLFIRIGDAIEIRRLTLPRKSWRVLSYQRFAAKCLDPPP